jgi:endonuclease-3
MHRRLFPFLLSALHICFLSKKFPCNSVVHFLKVNYTSTINSMVKSQTIPPSPSSSELSPPPSSPDIKNDAVVSRYFATKRHDQGVPVRKRRRINEPEPTVGDVPAVMPELPKLKRTSAKSSTAPQNWERIYDLVKEMRKARLAPVDTMGCATAADRTTSPQTQRFQTLISLMLSSQTKDTVNAATMSRLRSSLPGGLTLSSILAVAPSELNELISSVGFHRRKTDYIKKTAEILRDEYDGDIPDSVDGLTRLPGVGPKMAHLCMSTAWDCVTGIGVDVHVHRISNLWGWTTSKMPEETRAQLESWLPKDRWMELNWLLVGFGQTICLPRGRKCGECLLASEGLCRAAWKGNVAAKTQKKIKVEKLEDLPEDDDFKPKMETGNGVGFPPRNPRKKGRKVVKQEVKIEDDRNQMPDIEDAAIP